MAEPIPQSWKDKVLAVLHSNNRAKFIIRERARINWSDLFPNLFTGDLLIALSEALEQPDLPGKQEFGMNESGEVYAFIFTHSNRQVYTKINLLPDGTMVIIYSAHRPLKGNTL